MMTKKPIGTKTDSAAATSQIGIGQQSAVPRSTQPDAATSLLKIEAQLRQVRSYQELTYFLANEFRIFIRAQQVFVVRSQENSALKIVAVSALTHVDGSAPLVVGMQDLLRDVGRTDGLARHRAMDLRGSDYAGSDLAQTYPLPSLLWMPVLDLEGQVLGGMIFARIEPWSPSEIAVAEHLAGAAAMMWLAVRPKSWFRPGKILATGRSRLVALGVAVAIAVWPVSMSALAPAEVAPKDSWIVTAGVDGVVESVEVDPNAQVTSDQAVVRISDTVWRNRYEIAQREVEVAQSQQKRAAQLAFIDIQGRHELAVAQSELELKLAERDFAQEMLRRTVVTAQRDGIAFFADKRDLIGRPVATGEKLMEIVDPKSIQFNIDLPVSDAIVLTPGARVKIFLDSDPLRPVEAVLVRSDYKARQRDSQILSFRLVAQAAENDLKSVRLGVRGTAQIYSDKTPLIVYLLRRPLAAARQSLGI